MGSYSSGGQNFSDLTDGASLKHPSGVTEFGGGEGGAAPTKVADATGKRFPTAVREGLRSPGPVHGTVAVPVGTPAPIHADLVAERFYLKAHKDNTVPIFVGGPAVSKDKDANEGWSLETGQHFPFPIEPANLNTWSMVTSATGQRLHFVGEQVKPS